MTTHALAQMLLAAPDAPVFVEPRPDHLFAPSPVIERCNNGPPYVVLQGNAKLSDPGVNYLRTQFESLKP